MYKNDGKMRNLETLLFVAYDQLSTECLKQTTTFNGASITYTVARTSMEDDNEASCEPGPCVGPTKCGENKFCVGYEPQTGHVYCYGKSNGCKWSSNDCATDSDCSKYTTSSPKYTDRTTCPGSTGWRADACTCSAVSCRDGPHKNMYLPGYAADKGKTHASLEDAWAAALCDESAGGVTMLGDGKFQVRKGSKLGSSPTGETSWVKDGCSKKDPSFCAGIKKSEPSCLMQKKVLLPPALPPHQTYFMTKSQLAETGSVSADKLHCDYLDPVGASYRGSRSEAWDGSPCLPWPKQWVTLHHGQGLAKDDSACNEILANTKCWSACIAQQETNSFCRNPTDDAAPFCRTGGSEEEPSFKQCMLVHCDDSECTHDEPDGADYRGTQSWTISGKSCGKWADSRWSTMASASWNKSCRNFDGKLLPWCPLRQTDPDGPEWEYCDVGLSCRDTHLSRKRLDKVRACVGGAKGKGSCNEGCADCYLASASGPTANLKACRSACESSSSCEKYAFVRPATQNAPEPMLTCVHYIRNVPAHRQKNQHGPVIRFLIIVTNLTTLKDLRASSFTSANPCDICRTSSFSLQT